MHLVSWGMKNTNLNISSLASNFLALLLGSFYEDSSRTTSLIHNDHAAMPWCGETKILQSSLLRDLRLPQAARLRLLSAASKESGVVETELECASLVPDLTLGSSGDFR